MSDKKDFTPKELQREVDSRVSRIDFITKDMTEFGKFTKDHREAAEEAFAFAEEHNQVRLLGRAGYVLRLFECHDEDVLAQKRIKIVKEEIVGGKVVRQVRECAETDLGTFDNRGYELFKSKAEIKAEAEAKAKAEAAK